MILLAGFNPRHRTSLRRIATLAAVALLGAWHCAEAQVYPKAAPPGSTFVRVFNGTAVANVEAFVGDQPQGQMPPYAGPGFIFLKPGQYPVKIGSHSGSYQFDAEHYYSVVDTADGLHLFEMRGFESQLKAMILMFNLMPGSQLSLKTTDGRITVFDTVGEYKAGQREVNPISVSLAVFSGDQKLADAPPIVLERGKVFSLIVTGTPDSPFINWSDR